MNKDDDESLDDVNLLISKIKGTKNDEEAQKLKDAAIKSHAISAGETESDIGDFTALKKKMSTPDKTESPVTAPSSREDLVFPDTGAQLKKIHQNTQTLNTAESEIQIIDEDPKAALRPKSIKTTSAPPEIEPVTDADKKIVNVDQISDFSGLILPKGVSFKIDELQLHGRISSFEGTGTLPPDFDEI